MTYQDLVVCVCFLGGKKEYLETKMIAELKLFYTSDILQPLAQSLWYNNTY